jgi:phosphomannomutase/molybdopterin-guanine dinucleotide biosynthesis protein A
VDTVSSGRDNPDPDASDQGTSDRANPDQGTSDRANPDQDTPSSDGPDRDAAGQEAGGPGDLGPSRPDQAAGGQSGPNHDAPAPGAPVLAVVLAGGDRASRQLLSRKLGDQPVVDHVIAATAAVVAASNITIVVSADDDSLRSRLGERFCYAAQGEPLGPADAARTGLDGIGQPGRAGDETLVLIVSGDLALLRPASLRGLITRHRLKGADLSRLTLDGRDVGAYVAKAATWRELLAGAGRGSAVGRGSLTRIVGNAGGRGQAEIRDGAAGVGGPAAKQPAALKTSEYQIIDPDELHDINTDEDLATAADIQLKRLFAPQHAIESGAIRFGTGGWRAKIGEGFTIHNVRRLSQALAGQMIRDGAEAAGVVIGGDRRFLSLEAAEAAAEVFAGNNIPVTLLPGDVPTPLVTFAAPHLGAHYGLVFTASHNPPQWNGLKVFRQDGSLPLAAETDRYEADANALTREDIVATDLDAARRAGFVQDRDLTGPYIDAIEQIVDIGVIRANPLRVLVDPMYGTSQFTLGAILTDARCRVDFIHERHNPLFGGRSPAPDPQALTALIDLVRTGPYDLGLATDGDADRIAIVDQDGRYISTNDLLALLYWYLHEIRGERGGVVRNIATTHLLDRLAAHFQESSREVPVGFKHITKGMSDDAALLGGESSGGLTIRGHILGKDGIFACALVVEMLARTGRPLAELLDNVYALAGRLYAVETALPATPEMRLAVPRRLAATLSGGQGASANGTGAHGTGAAGGGADGTGEPGRGDGIGALDNGDGDADGDEGGGEGEAGAVTGTLGGLPIVRLDQSDGFKFYLGGDAWGLLRFSGTEPVLRVFAEAPSAELADRVAQDLVRLASGPPQSPSPGIASAPAATAGPNSARSSEPATPNRDGGA